jgi:hypothetical protein
MMEIVIKISKEDFEIMKHNIAVHNPLCPLSQEDIVVTIANGTPLPKNHGRLIDADALGEELNRYTEAPYQYALKVFNDALTIIEADKDGNAE